MNKIQLGMLARYLRYRNSQNTWAWYKSNFLVVVTTSKATKISAADARNNKGNSSQNTINHGEDRHPSHSERIGSYVNPKGLYGP